MIPTHSMVWIGMHRGIRFRPWCWCSPLVGFLRDENDEPSTISIHREFGDVAYADDGKAPV